MSDPPLHDVRPFLATCRELVDGHALDRVGAYRRWTRSGEHGDSRDLRCNPYGCADAANLLYTLDELPEEPRERSAWVATLRSLQDPSDGLFHETTHHAIHTTAHCLAALELFDARPLHPLQGLAPLRDPDEVERFLDALDWRANPWIEAHRGAGLYAALLLAGEIDEEWEKRYFDWLERESDPATGMLRRGALAAGSAGDPLRFPCLAGTFHYLFNQEHAGRRLRHPQALIDTCLDIHARALFPFQRFVGFAEIDWVYCLNRALRQCDHRRDEARAALRRFAADHVAFLRALDPTDPGLDDLHALFGTVCALAELQQALPGEIASDRPLRLVLDRRPFI